MSRKSIWILAAMSIGIATWGLISLSNKIVVRYAGQKVMGIVKQTPTECDRYNHIIVLVDGIEYRVSISRENCRKNVYKIDQKVALLKYKDYKNLEWPGSHPELVIILILMLLTFGVYSARKKYIKEKGG